MPDLTNIVYRGSLNRPLTHSELDTNFNLLNSYLVEQSSNTGYAILPAGTTAERPLGATAGYFRYNTETSILEGYTGNQWQDFNLTGYTGSLNVGERGYTGSKGSSGVPGFRGSLGANSLVVGPTGDVGATGENGFTGSVGAVGYAGIPGSDGPRGPVGYDGPRGYTGSPKSNAALSYNNVAAGYYTMNINNTLSINNNGSIVSNVSIADPNICINRNDTSFSGGSKYLSLKLNSVEICTIEAVDTNTVGFFPKNGATLIFSDTSDYRIKTNLSKISDTLDKISKLTVYTCNYINTPKRFRSLLAHELQLVYPHAVTGKKDEVDENNNPIYQAIDYSKLIPVLISGINELSTKIEKIKNDYNIFINTK